MGMERVDVLGGPMMHHDGSIVWPDAETTIQFIRSVKEFGIRGATLRPSECRHVLKRCRKGRTGSAFEIWLEPMFLLSTITLTRIIGQRVFIC